MASSDFPGWILKALAGNPHDVNWGRPAQDLTKLVEDEFTAGCRVVAWSMGRNTEALYTGLYPIEVDEQMQGTAWITGGFQMPNQMESFQPSAQLLSGAVVDILVPVEFTQYPEAFLPSAQLLSGTVYETLNPVAFSQYPEKFLPSAQLLSGAVTDDYPPAGVDLINPPETMTGTSWIVDGTLE